MTIKDLPSHYMHMFPYKSVALGLILTVFLGPVGLLYASCFAGITMIILGFVVFSSKLLVPIVLHWVICVVWGVFAVELYNKKQFSQWLKLYAPEVNQATPVE